MVRQTHNSNVFDKHNHKYERNRQNSIYWNPKRENIKQNPKEKLNTFLEENGESDEQTLIREIAEELSVAIIPPNI
jgi:NADH pyrophosphatase NudC (nudix superfamily)